MRPRCGSLQRTASDVTAQQPWPGRLPGHRETTGRKAAPTPLSGRPSSVLCGLRGVALSPSLPLVAFDPAVTDVDDAVGVIGDVALVGHEDDGVAALVELREQRHDLVARGGVKVAGGLVG